MSVQLHSDLSVTQKISGIAKCIDDNRLVDIIYKRPSKNGNNVSVTQRQVKPSHIYVYNDGTAYFRGYCMLKKAVRTFRLDRISAMGVTEPLPRKDALIVYPAQWELRKACAQVVKDFEKWVASGWSSKPVILTEPSAA